MFGMSPPDPRPTSLGFVAIGRNEGERLRACLESLPRGHGRVVYVDSGSVDGSVDLARSVGAEVVELDMTKPFTAARARNAGIERLREIVHFHIEGHVTGAAVGSAAVTARSQATKQPRGRATAASGLPGSTLAIGPTARLRSMRSRGS